MTRRQKVVVLGAGIAGLGAAYIMGKEAVVYEKENYYGGLCHSFNIGGYKFDTAVHLSFTEKDKVRAVFDKVSYRAHKPDPINYYQGKWIKHPIQNNLYQLSEQEKLEAILSFLDRPREYDKVQDYKQWLNSQYGEYIANHFMDVYTKKYWGRPAEQLGIGWINCRLTSLTKEELIEGAILNNEKSKYYAKEMRYPKEGGFESFLLPLVENANVKYNKEVSYINTKEKSIRFKDGDIIKYEALLSSIPLPEIIPMIDEVPDEVQCAANNLTFTSMILVSIGFKTNIIQDKLWYYVYDEDIPFCRVYSPSLKSPNNVPQNTSSIQCEMYFDSKDPIMDSYEVIKEKVCRSLYTMGICNEEDINCMDIRKIKYANVVFDTQIEKNKNLVLEFLKERDIQSIGRFGEWEYYWSDQSLMSGINAANNIVQKA